MEKMKVLFVCSGNSQSPFIISQAESLKGLDIEIAWFKILGAGLFGYLRNIMPLRVHIKKNKFDLIHAHYGLSCWVAILAMSKLPKVVSFMGDDVYGESLGIDKTSFRSTFLILLSKLLQPFVRHIIVKSENIKESVIFKHKCSLIPNGVNLDQFYLTEKNTARERIEVGKDEKILLFLGDPLNPSKNFEQVKKAVNILKIPGLNLLTPFPVPYNEVNLYLNAADVLIMTSFAEGSPNIIKEAMACNCPIVSTDVGDVKWIFGDTDGCFLTTFNHEDTAAKIKSAIEFAENKGRTKGRERIIELGLDSETVAIKIKNIYKNILK